MCFILLITNSLCFARPHISITKIIAIQIEPIIKLILPSGQCKIIKCTPIMKGLNAHPVKTDVRILKTLVFVYVLFRNIYLNLFLLNMKYEKKKYIIANNKDEKESNVLPPGISPAFIIQPNTNRLPKIISTIVINNKLNN